MQKKQSLFQQTHKHAEEIARATLANTFTRRDNAIERVQNSGEKY